MYICFMFNFIGPYIHNINIYRVISYIIDNSKK